MSTTNKKRSRPSSNNNRNQENNANKKLKKSSVVVEQNNEQKSSLSSSTTKVSSQRKNPFDIVGNNSVFIQRIVPLNQQKKVKQTIEQHLKKRKTQKKKNDSNNDDSSDSDDSSDDSDSDEELDWVQETVSKYPIAFANQLSDTPFFRYLFYKKHFGALKHQQQQQDEKHSSSFTTSLFNQKLLQELDSQHHFGAKITTTTADDANTEKEDKQLKKLIEKRSKNQTLFLTNVPYNETPQSVTQFFEQVFDAKLNKCLFSDLLKQQQQALEKGEETMVLNSRVDTPFSDHKTNHFLSGGTVHVVLNEANKMNQALIAPELLGAPSADGEETHNNGARRSFAFSTATKREQEQQEAEDDDGSTTGLKRYMNEHLYHQLTTGEKLQSTKSFLNQWMMHFDQSEKSEEELIEALRGQTDADGWTKVIAPKGKRHLPPPQKEDIEKKNATAKRPTKFKDQVEMPFYKYQRAEQKKKEIELLRQKFEQDKQLIEQMKNNKQFKPY